MANVQYFYTDEDGQKQGPVAGEELARLVMEGVVKPTASIEHAGTRWKGRAEEVHDFFTGKSSTSTSGIFDIGFTQFISNTWISILWVLIIILAILGCVITLLVAVFNDAPALLIIAPFAAALFLLLMRMAFELTIVVFRMETRLRTIEKNSETMSRIEEHLRAIRDKYENK